MYQNGACMYVIEYVCMWPLYFNLSQLPYKTLGTVFLFWRICAIIVCIQYYYFLDLVQTDAMVGT